MQRRPWVGPCAARVACVCHWLSWGARARARVLPGQLVATSRPLQAAWWPLAVPWRDGIRVCGPFVPSPPRLARTTEGSGKEAWQGAAVLARPRFAGAWVQSRARVAAPARRPLVKPTQAARTRRSSKPSLSACNLGGLTQRVGGLAHATRGRFSPMGGRTSRARGLCGECWRRFQRRAAPPAKVRLRGALGRLAVAGR